MYYKEFPVMFDWVHNGEGLSVFNLQGLSNRTTRGTAIESSGLRAFT